MVYTDDCEVVGESQDMMRQIFDVIHKKWGAKVVDENFVLGIHRQVERDDDSGYMSVEMTMTAFVEGMVKSVQGHLDEERVTTPFPEKLKLSRMPYECGDVPDSEVAEVLERGYMRVVGQLLWCARNVFAECVTGVSMLCRLMSVPTFQAWDAAMHMIKWIDMNKGRGIKFTNPGYSIVRPTLSSNNTPQATGDSPSRSLKRPGYFSSIKS